MDITRIERTLAIAAVGVALTVALADAAGEPAPRDPAASAPGDWAQAVEREEDHIAPRALADLMLSTPDRVVTVDVRPADEFRRWHLPGAVNLTVPELLGAPGDALLTASAGKLVVLYSNGMVHPAQAWMELARRGHRDVRVLEGGLTDFKRVVLTPPSLRGPISEARARAELPRFRAAQAFFLPKRPVAGAAVVAEHPAPTR